LQAAEDEHKRYWDETTRLSAEQHNERMRAKQKKAESESHIFSSTNIRMLTGAVASIGLGVALQMILPMIRKE
jgi:hypothetical protein